MFRTSAKYVFLMDLVRLWILLTWIGNNASLAANSCREAGKCCPGRDSSCVAQKAQINAIIEDLSDQPCYCDHACLKLGDCCHDFKETCHVIDCQMSEWEPWSECDTDCGPGTMTRTRVVYREAANGGQRCTELEQHRGCYGRKCNTHKASQDTAMILPASLDYTRTVNVSKDIRRNLKLKYLQDTQQDESNIDFCVEFEVVKGSKGCRHDTLNKILHHNNNVCVMCAKTAMHKEHDYYCRGQGSPNHATRFTSVNLPTCHGRWIQKAVHDKCSCKNGADFIFV